MNNQNAIIAANDIIRIAKRLQVRGHRHADGLTAIAQWMLNGQNPMQDMTAGLNTNPPNVANAGGFDPSQGQNYSIQEMKGVEEQPDAASSTGVERSNGPMVDERKTHTCSVTFKAPEGVTESDMMNYILGISKHLECDVEKFQWSKQVAKVTTASVRHAQQFDPSVNMQVQQMGKSEDAGMHPGIASFVNPSASGNGGHMVDNRTTHTCSVTFKAPESVTESDMMNYILGISKNLECDVEKFQWSKQVAKVTEI